MRLALNKISFGFISDVTFHLLTYTPRIDGDHISGPLAKRTFVANEGRCL